MLKQTNKNIEIIILNDASPYDIDAIVNKFSDGRIKYLKNKINIGSKDLVSVWNKILELASGELFVLFSDDDIYEPNFIEEIVSVADKNQNANVFRTLVKIIDENNCEINRTANVPIFENAHDYLVNRIKGKRQHYIPEVVFRTEKLKATGFISFPLAWYSDEATCFIQALNGGIVTIDKYLVNWRYSNSNISAVGNIFKRIQAGVDYQKWLQKKIINIWDDSNQILLLNKHRTEQNKKNVLIRTARRNIFLGTFDILKNGLIVRQKFGLSYYLIITGVLSFIKNYSRGKN